jgi:hypothetical protein
MRRGFGNFVRERSPATRGCFFPVPPRAVANFGMSAVLRPVLWCIPTTSSTPAREEVPVRELLACRLSHGRGISVHRFVLVFPRFFLRGLSHVCDRE